MPAVPIFCPELFGFGSGPQLSGASLHEPVSNLVDFVMEQALLNQMINDSPAHQAHRAQHQAHQGASAHAHAQGQQSTQAQNSFGDSVSQLVSMLNTVMGNVANNARAQQAQENEQAQKPTSSQQSRDAPKCPVNDSAAQLTNLINFAMGEAMKTMNNCAEKNQQQGAQAQQVQHPCHQAQQAHGCHQAQQAHGCPRAQQKYQHCHRAQKAHQGPQAHQFSRPQHAHAAPRCSFKDSVSQMASLLNFVVEDVMSNSSNTQQSRPTQRASSNAQTVTYNDNGDMLINFPVQGYLPQDLSLSLDHERRLQLQGEHHERQGIEAIDRQFNHSIVIPESLDIERIQCELDPTEGVLEIVVPKIEQPEAPKRLITIQLKREQPHVQKEDQAQETLQEQPAQQAQQAQEGQQAHHAQKDDEQAQQQDEFVYVQPEEHAHEAQQPAQQIKEDELE